MPELLERPTQQAFSALDEKKARIQALSDITLLWETCKAQIADKTNVFQKGNMVAYSEIKLDPTSKAVQLSAYEKVIQESNLYLERQNQPFSLSMEMKDGQYFLVSGYYQKADNTFAPKAEGEAQAKSPEVTLSKETYAKLTLIIAPYIKPALSQRETPIEHTKRELNGLIAALRDNVQLVNESSNVQTPEELALAIMDYKAGKGPKPDTFCVPLSLLAYRVLEHEGYNDPAVIVFNPVESHGREFQRGEEVQGHTTATIVVKGLLVDPAMHDEVKTISPIILDPNNKSGYGDFITSIELHYPEVFAKSKFVDISMEAGEDQLKSRYLLEQGNRTGNSDYLIEAASLNPSNYYASIRAGDTLRNLGSIEEVAGCYIQASDKNPELYVANYSACVSLINNWESLTETEKRLTVDITLKAVSLRPTLFLPNYQLVRLADKLEDLALAKVAWKNAAEALPEGDPNWVLLGKERK